MNRFIAACLLPAVLAGCTITAGVQGIKQQIEQQLPGDIGQLDDVIYGIAIAKDQAARRFEAQINGTMPPPPPLPQPAPVPVTPTPVPSPLPTPAPVSPTPVPGPAPSGPIVTPRP